MLASDFAGPIRPWHCTMAQKRLMQELLPLKKEKWVDIEVGNLRTRVKPFAWVRGS